MKHFEVVGYTLPGCAFCLECEPEDNDEKNVIFAGNEGWNDWSCDSCNERLDPDYSSEEDTYDSDYTDE